MIDTLGVTQPGVSRLGHLIEPALAAAAAEPAYLKVAIARYFAVHSFPRIFFHGLHHGLVLGRHCPCAATYQQLVHEAEV